MMRHRSSVRLAPGLLSVKVTIDHCLRESVKSVHAAKQATRQEPVLQYNPCSSQLETKDGTKKGNLTCLTYISIDCGPAVVKP